MIAACGAPAPNLSETQQLAVVVGPASHSFGTIPLGASSPPATFVVSPAGSGDTENRITAVLGCPGFTIDAAGLPAEVFRRCGGLEPEPGTVGQMAVEAAACPNPAVQSYSFTARYSPTTQGVQQCVGQIVMSSGVQTFTMTGTGEAPPFVIDVRPSMVQFVDIRVDNPSNVRTVTLTNLGSQDLQLNLSLTGNTSEIALTQGSLGMQPLPKGTSTKLDFVCTPSAPSVFTAGLRVLSNDPNKGTIDIPITCNGIESNLDVSPTSIDAETLVGLPRELTVRLRNDGNVAGVLKSVTLSNPHPAITFATSPPESLDLGAGESVDVTVRFDPTAKISEDDGLGSVSVTFDDDEPRTIPITGGAKLATVLSSPNVVEFGQVCIGVPKQDLVEVYAGDDGAFVLSDATVAGPYAVATPASQTLGPGTDRARLMVSAVAVDEGELAGMLTVTTNAPGQTAFEVPLHAFGLASGITVDKPELAVGAVEVDSFTPAQTVTVTNCSGAPVMVLDQRIIGPHANEFALTKVFQPASIPNAEGIGIDVLFAPKDIGRREATLLVEYAGGILEVALTGDALGVEETRDTYYRCSTGGSGAWPVGLVVFAIVLRRRRR